MHFGTRSLAGIENSKESLICIWGPIPEILNEFSRNPALKSPIRLPYERNAHDRYAPEGHQPLTATKILHKLTLSNWGQWAIRRGKHRRGWAGRCRHKDTPTKKHGNLTQGRIGNCSKGQLQMMPPCLIRPLKNDFEAVWSRNDISLTQMVASVKRAHRKGDFFILCFILFLFLLFNTIHLTIHEKKNTKDKWIKNRGNTAIHVLHNYCN